MVLFLKSMSSGHKQPVILHPKFSNTLSGVTYAVLSPQQVAPSFWDW